MFLDRKIRIERLTTTTAPTGEPVESWGLLKETWARVNTKEGKETFLNTQTSFELTTVAPMIFTIRYFSDLKTKDRIIFEGDNFNIMDVSENVKFGRKRFMDVLAESRT